MSTVRDHSTTGADAQLSDNVRHEIPARNSVYLTATLGQCLRVPATASVTDQQSQAIGHHNQGAALVTDHT
jgi:hypothetical protein